MARRPEWVGSAMLGLVVVAVAAVAFYVTSPARRAPARVPLAQPPTAPPPAPMPPPPAVADGPVPSGATSVVARPRVSPLGPEDVLPDPPLAIAAETPPPFDLPDGGCPPGCEIVTKAGGSGCAHPGPDGGVVPNGPWTLALPADTETGQMVEGQRVGPWTLFDQEGRRLRLRYYDHDGRVEGRELWWDAQGTLVMERWYSQGQLHGVEVRHESDREVRTQWYMGRKLREDRSP